MLAVKIVHFLALAIGIGGSAANLLLAVRAATIPAEARPGLGAIQRLIGRVAFGCVLLLWASGLAMLYARYGGWAGQGVLFWLKIAAVAVLTVAATGLQVLTVRAQIAKAPPPRTAMLRLAVAANASAMLAVLFAVLAFG
ncbi:MAG: hypothetical protein R3F55_09915 [Alphaproteobacteria bacterium]